MRVIYVYTLIRKLALLVLLQSSVIYANEEVTDKAFNHFQSDVFNVTEQQLSVDYWLKKSTDNTVLFTVDNINQQNESLLNNNPDIYRPLKLPSQLSKKALLQLLDNISQWPSKPSYFQNGGLVSVAAKQTYIDNLNRQGVKEYNPVLFGLVTKRTSLRRFASNDGIYNKDHNQYLDFDIDRFQESGLFTGDAVAILHQSSDKKWYLVQAYNYVAWVEKSAIAIATREQVNAFKQSKHFIMVTGSKIFTNYVPNHHNISNVALTMGVKLPLASADEYSNILYGQNPYANYVVKLPIRTEDGKLAIVLVMIPRSQDVHKGYLPFTHDNIIKQAFKFLGERYGWGHAFNGRDCSGFVDEVFKSFGFIMPRNSGAQGKSQYGINSRFTSIDTIESKKKALKSLQIGDLIYIPGHVMIFIGNVNDEPYVIHDVKGFTALKNNNRFYRGALNGVSVTPLTPLYTTEDKSYLDEIYTIKRVFNLKQD